MCDPTFTHQFAMATQADILRQATRDRSLDDAGCSPDDAGRLARLIMPLRRVPLALWARLHRTDLTPGWRDVRAE